MAVEHMQGQLRKVDSDLLAAVQEIIASGREAYHVPTWRGRVALVESSSLGNVVIRSVNGDTMWRLKALGRIMIADNYSDLPDVRGLPTSGGRSQRRLPRDQHGRRITLPEKTGDNA
jgi:hypothetical protein